VKGCDCSLCRARRDARFAEIVASGFTRREVERLDDLSAPPNASLRARVGAYTMRQDSGREHRADG
jgi:hypothetical protein